MTNTFSGTPPLNFDGVIEIEVTASDGTLSQFDTFTLTVVAENDAPVIHTPDCVIYYWAENTWGNVTAINQISFDDVDAGNNAVRVTFKMDDCGDALNACNLLGSGVTVVSGNGMSQITLRARRRHQRLSVRRQSAFGIRIAPATTRPAF